MTTALPDLVVELLLRRPGTLLEDGGVVRDVWLRFARSKKNEPIEVLLSPAPGVGSVELGAELYGALKNFRKANPKDRKPGSQQGVAPLDSYVVASLTLNELIRVVLPLTKWWRDRKLDLLTQPALQETVRTVLGERVKSFLTEKDIDSAYSEAQIEAVAKYAVDHDLGATDRVQLRTGLGEAGAVLALIAVLLATQSGQVKTPKTWQSTAAAARPPGERAVWQWLSDNSGTFLATLNDEIRARDFAVMQVVRRNVFDAAGIKPEGDASTKSMAPPALVTRVFENRRVGSANRPGATVKADAATQLFNISCKDITWAIIDSGIDSSHPAFLAPATPPGRRIRGTYDFTAIERIRAVNNEDDDFANETIRQLSIRQGGLSCSVEEAKRLLADIGQRMIVKQNPPWEVIEPLIRIDPSQPAAPGDGAKFDTKHGTHVAGILGGNWHENGTPVMQGICPDINLYDLRVVTSGGGSRDGIEGTESAVMAALDFVQFLNRRGTQRGWVVHGVNVSLQIPFEPGRYGCGATPVCDACDQISGTGVVVVAAAGNLGWRPREAKFGDYVHSSITDPGNARTVITVGATHATNPHTYGISYFSSRGPTGDGRSKPDVVAPGEKIPGPVPYNGREEMDGTSMAAPIVSGVAAMLLSRYPELIGHPDQVKDIICRTATDLGRERYFQGHGLVDALRALQSV